MLKRTTALALCLTTAFFVGTALQSGARDSISLANERPIYKAIPVQQAESDMPPVAPERQAPQRESSKPAGSGGGYLTGSASATGSGIGAMVRPQAPRYASIPSNMATLGADADQFLLGARNNEVVSPTAMKGWLQGTHPEFNLSAQNNPAQVIEIKGQWDDAGQIMTNMGIRHERIKSRELRDFLSSDTKVVVVNCEGRIPADQIEVLRQWVIRGGYLITTDWSLNNLVERAFPGIVAWSGSKTHGTVVDAIVVAPDSPLLAGTNNLRRATWKLDEQSQELKVLKPDVVQVLARSYVLARQDQQAQYQAPVNTGVLACTFPYGRGRVLHLVGHFDYNSGFGFTRNILPDAIPGAGVGLRQAIATNFLLEGLQRKH